jgi:hypothetical protein
VPWEANEPAEAGSEPSVGSPVPGHTLLYRRVHRVHYKRMADGSFRMRDTAFKNPRTGLDMSVQLGDKLAELGRTPYELRSADATLGIAEIEAQVMYDNDQRVARTPKPDDEAHGDVIGEKPGARRKVFVRAARWAVPPEPD